MELHMTPLAKERLVQRLAGKPGMYKIFYDTVGCGCNGIIVLLLVNERSEFDVDIQTDSVPFIVDPKQQHNLDHIMRLDADKNYPSFKLSSDSSLFGNNIVIRDVRDVEDDVEQDINQTLANSEHCALK
jgi:uncharacterized protein YqkB